MKRRAARKIVMKAKPARAKKREKKREKTRVVRVKKSGTRKAAAPSPDAFDTLVAAGSHALGITIDPVWHANVKFNLQLIFRHAALVDEFPLPDDAEPAPVYRA
jgi:hypothetical protein